MKSKLSLGILALSTLLLYVCEHEEEVKEVTITNVTPGTTIVGGATLNTAQIGDTMAIAGQHFSPVANENRVSVHGIPSTVIAASETEIMATVPAGVPFSYVDLEVARAGYLKAVSRISVRETPSPVITGINPTGGPVGTVVTIYGRNLGETLESSMIAFSDSKGNPSAVVVTPFIPIATAQNFIQVKIPAGAGTGANSLSARPTQDIHDQALAIVTPKFTVSP